MAYNDSTGNEEKLMDLCSGSRNCRMWIWIHSRFLLFAVVMFSKVTMDTELVNSKLFPREIHG